MENYQDLIFIGFRCFKGKKDDSKIYYLLNFITPPVTSQNKDNAFSKNIDLFVNKDVYNNFINDNELLDTVKVPYEIYGDKVRYVL